MAHCSESDATFCSDVEKEECSQIRRSKRLSKKQPIYFRSSLDRNLERLYEIYRFLQSDKFCSIQSKNDWLALNIEVDILRKSLNGKARSKFSYIIKKINQHLSQQKNPSEIIEAPVVYDNNVELEKSPNILAGMTTDVFTELPPYQPQNLINIMKADQHSRNILTQVNPLDLTKKCLESHTADREVSIQTEINHDEQNPIASHRTTPIILKDSLIDLTDEHEDEDNEENTKDPVHIKEIPKPKCTAYVSKWLKYLSTQERQPIGNKEPQVIPLLTKENSMPLKQNTRNFCNDNGQAKKKMSLKQSIQNLYNDNGQVKTNISVKTKKPKSSPSKYNQRPKSKQPSTIKHPGERCDFFRNTENFSTLKDPEMLHISQRHAQTEHMSSLSPGILLEDLMELDAPTLDDCDSVISFSPSLKEGFKKVFGTDSLHKVFGCEEVIYSLTEDQVKLLATALKIEHITLKKAIEEVLNNDNYEFFGNDMQSDSSIVDCSQSPPQRLFPSQRSQVSK